jgi:hypothetical protein
MRVMFMSPSRPGALAGWVLVVVLLLLFASVGTASVENKRVLWIHQYGSSGWEKWTPRIEFDASEECNAAVAQMLAGIRAPSDAHAVVGSAPRRPVPRVSGGDCAILIQSA